MRKALALALAFTLSAPPTGAADLMFLARPAPALVLGPPRAALAAPAPAPRLELPPAPEASEEALYGTKKPPAPDRILIKADRDIVGVAGDALGRALFLAQSMARLPRLAGPWLEGRGFRYRVVYLDSLGATHGRPDGFLVKRPGQADRWVPAQVPEALRRPAPIYFRGMTVRYQVEVEAAEDLEGLVVSAREEELDGRVLTPFALLGTLTLKAGQRGVVRGSSPLLGTSNDGPVNFERTHVIAGMESESTLRADAPDAGLVDPPGN